MIVACWDKIRNNIDFRMKFFLIISLICNFVYTVFLFVVSKIYSSKWFFIMSIYYGLLSIVRIFIFPQINPQKELSKKIKVMRASGYFLVLLNIVVIVMMFLLVYTTQYVKHHEIVAIALAAYTFSALTIAIMTSVKHLKSDNHVYASVKVISLVSASVSMVTLTNAMLATWGTEDMLLRKIILPTLGGAVSIFIIVSSILLIRKANFDLRILKNEEE